MKEMTLEQFAQRVPVTGGTAQQEHILITRAGKPVAVWLGIEDKDQEDWYLEISPAFWRMIEERRRETDTIPLAQAQAELFAGKEWMFHYTMIIQWSDADRAFVASLPEFGAKAGGSTYADAARHGQELLESLVESYLANGKPLPEPSQAGPPVPAT